MANLEELKKDIDSLANNLRQSEKDVYNKIYATNTSVSDLNATVKLVVDKLSNFIETFKNHDSVEMQKYDNILEMFKQSQTETKKLEEKLSHKFITKEEMKNFETKLEETSKAVKQGFKIFYIGTGIVLTFGVVGGLIMWVLNLISKLQQMGVH